MKTKRQGEGQKIFHAPIYLASLKVYHRRCPHHEHTPSSSVGKPTRQHGRRQNTPCWRIFFSSPLYQKKKMHLDDDETAFLRSRHGPLIVRLCQQHPRRDSFSGLKRHHSLLTFRTPRLQSKSNQQQQQQQLGKSGKIKDESLNNSKI